MSQLSPVSFHGDILFCIEYQGQPYTPAKPIVENLGLSWGTQSVKLNANRKRWGVSIIETPSEGGDQQTLCIPVRKLPAFLASINPKKVRPELREKVELYQAECDDALWNYWMKGRATRKPRQLRMEQAALPTPPRFDETPFLRLAEDIRTFQQSYRRSYGLLFARLYEIGAPVFLQLEQRATLRRELVPFSDMTIHGQFDRFLSQRLREGMASFSDPLPDRDNPAMLLLACARAMNIR